MEVSQKALNQRILYRDQFTEFARDCLTIRTKAGDLRPFTLNKAQAYLHNKLEDQKARTGKIRAIILKGRQQGCSTYVEGRFYWKTIHQFGIKSFILSHERKSTSNLYKMVNRFHDNCPAALKPSTSTSNAQELVFDRLDSAYGLGTAGNESVGRSDTIQYFHGSEVAFWPARTEGELTKGILQAVPDMAGTEVIFESTANGIGNFFHTEVQKAVRGEGDFELIFIPWFWQEEYRRPQSIDFEPTEEEMGLMDQFGLDAEQIEWRRNKIIELTNTAQSGEKAFKQEYPNTINEAFQYSVEGSLIKPEDVERARKAVVEPGNVLVVGVDPSRGGDRFSVVKRRGRVMYEPESHTGEINLGRAVQICRKILDDEKPAKMFIDFGGGADLVDRLHELGYEDQVTAVAFGGKATRPERFKNRRTEMWGDMADWLTHEVLPVSLPNSDSLQMDLCTPKAWYNSSDQLCMQSKDELPVSPDEGDAAALTFAERVIDPSDTGGRARKRDRSRFE